MTSIKLILTGAHAWASVEGPLTSGMVGIPIIIEYDEAWEGLTKNLMCRCSPWNSNDGEIRTILNVGETSAVAHEVMQAGMYLHLGVEGFSADGKLVMPTAWARCGKIEYGANTCEDPSTDPELSVWNQLQIEMKQTKEYVLTPEQAVNIQSYAQTATQAAQTASQAAEEAKQAVESGLYYIPSVSQATDTTLKFEFKPSITGAPIPKPVTVELPGGNDSGESGLLNTEQIDALDSMFKVTAYDGGAAYADAYAAFRLAFGLDDSEDGDTAVKAVVSITVTYSGDAVPVGTAVSALTGVVVTAHYSDGSTATVTGYTLSGEVLEGENIITVTYEGMTATFAVTGTAETGDDSDGGDSPDTGVSNETTWADGVAYIYQLVENEYVGSNGTGIKSYDGWSRTPYLYCAGASRLEFTDTSSLQATYSAFYDEQQNHLSNFIVANKTVEVPSDAVYFIVSGPDDVMAKLTATPYAQSEV